MNELGVLKDAIHDLLATNAFVTAAVSTRIYSGRAKQNDPRPYINYGLQSGIDIQGLGDVRLLSQDVFRVKIIMDGYPNLTIERALDGMDEALGKLKAHVKSSITGNAFVISARSVGSFDFQDPDNALITHSGKMYRFEVSESGA